MVRAHQAKAITTVFVKRIVDFNSVSNHTIGDTAEMLSFIDFSPWFDIRDDCQKQDYD
jgi:hypothetical protein